MGTIPHRYHRAIIVQLDGGVSRILSMITSIVGSNAEDSAQLLAARKLTRRLAFDQNLNQD